MSEINADSVGYLAPLTWVRGFGKLYNYLYNISHKTKPNILFHILSFYIYMIDIIYMIPFQLSFSDSLFLNMIIIEFLSILVLKLDFKNNV